MQQASRALFILGVLFAFVAGQGLEQTWLPVGLAIFGVFVGFVSMVDTNTISFLNNKRITKIDD